jgi:hypothetical protein
MLDWPLLALLLCMYVMPGTPFTCVSIAVVVVCSTVCASAPVKLLVICTVGGVIFGYWLMGIFKIASVPTIKITSDITIAVTGRLRNIFDDEFMFFVMNDG